MKKRLLYLLTFLPFATIGQTFELVKTFLGHTSGIETVTFSPDGKNIISGDLEGNIFFWDIQTGSISKMLKAHKGEVIQITFSTDEKLMCTCSDDGTVKLWDLKKLELLKSQSISEVNEKKMYNSINICVISPDNEYILYGRSEGSLMKVSTTNNSTPKLLYDHPNGITDGLLSFDKTHFIFSAGYSIYFYNLATGKIDNEIGTCEAFVNNIALSPTDKNIIVSWCQDGTLNFWNINKKMNISSIKAGDEHYTKIAFSYDGKYLISGNSKSNARVWDPITKSLLYELKGHTGAVRDLRFSPDNKFIVTSSYDGTLKLWKTPVLENEEPEKLIEENKPEVHFEENNIPVHVSNRAIIKQEDVSLKSQEIEFYIWDNIEEDGDTISLNINGTWVLENYEVTKKKKSIKYTLQPNTNNYLILYAHNLGKNPPNTAAVSIYDGDKEKILTLKSDLKSCGAINFIYKQ